MPGVKSISLDDIRVTLHVLAATVWVGGQITLAALVPVVRRAAAPATRPVARRFAALAWSAFAVLVVTGVWNVAAEWHRMDRADRVTLQVKVALVLVSAVAALVHQRTGRPAVLAVSGALSALAAIAAVLFGVVLSDAG
jgi:putative copper export protein